MSGIDTSKWTQEQRDAYDRAVAEAEFEAASFDAEKAKREADASSPEALIAAAAERAEQVKRERERAAREAADDAAYKAAVRKHGGEHRVARVRTFAGSIILRAAGKEEWSEFQQRITGLSSDDTVTLAKSMTLDLVEHPTRERVRQLADSDFPNLWIYLWGARDRLVDGLEQEARGNG